MEKLVGPGLEKPEQILQSNTDAEEWRLEVERVAPQLKVYKMEAKREAIYTNLRCIGWRLRVRLLP